jgi:hypothetical protein
MTKSPLLVPRLLVAGSLGQLIGFVFTWKSKPQPLNGLLA